MDKALSEMNTKELFCALTGEYGPIRQAYVQTAFRKYKEQHGEYAELTEMHGYRRFIDESKRHC